MTIQTKNRGRFFKNLSRIFFFMGKSEAIQYLFVRAKISTNNVYHILNVHQGRNGAMMDDVEKISNSRMDNQHNVIRMRLLTKRGLAAQRGAGAGILVYIADVKSAQTTAEVKIWDQLGPTPRAPRFLYFGGHQPKKFHFLNEIERIACFLKIQVGVGPHSPLLGVGDGININHFIISMIIYINLRTKLRTQRLKPAKY